MRPATLTILRPIAFALLLCSVPTVAKAQIAPPLEPLRGILVTAIVPGSTADQAGMQPGDIVRRVNDHRVTDLWDFVERLSQTNGVARLSVFDRARQQFRIVQVRPDRNGLIGVYGIPTERIF